MADGRPETRAGGAGRLLLGIDTGGTYTDAAILDGDRLGEGPPALLAKAKRLTTHGDLAEGVGAALRAALAAGGAAPGEIGLVSLSTTLATNALVEGRGGRAALVAIGFSEDDLARQGLGEALGGAAPIIVAGGHDAGGAARAPLDEAALRAAVAAAPAEAYAVCAHFAVRNPEHEIRAAEILRAETGRPVTPSHRLSARIGGPRRALTALLNARLTPLIDRLVAAVEALMAEAGIAAPLMVVRGDGALVSAAFARERPVETILSGPAASLVGAGWLTGLADAVVSDIGGTTTDIAVLSGGRPRLDPEGARVGGHRTMVEAVAMATHGLGGDSEVRLEAAGLGAGIALGPRRAVPLALAARDHPDAVRAALAEAARAPRVEPERLVLFLPAGDAAPPEGPERALLDRLAGGPLPAAALAPERRARAALARLEAAGAVRRAAFTPSDAAHALGLQSGWDAAAAAAAADLLARAKGRDGKPVAPDGPAFARAVVERLVRRSADLVLEAALVEDGLPEGLAASPLAAAALEGRRGLVAPALPLTVPLVGLGASAATYYPAVAAKLGADARIPAHAEVANAVGAVVGGVRIRRRGSVTVPADGVYRAHLPDGPRDFPSAEAAEAALLAALSAAAEAEARAAGAEAPEPHHRIARKVVTIEGRETYVEAEIAVTATGRPRLAREEETP